VVAPLTRRARKRLALAALAPALGLAALGSPPDGASAGERLHFSANLVGRGAVDCAHPTAPRTLIGAVARAGHDSLVVDSRSPLADGSALPNAFTVVAPGFPGFDRYLAPGAFVRIDLEVRRQGGCAERILIQSLDAWDGQPSPSRRSVFFAGNDGLWEPFPQAPFQLTRSPVDCARIAAVARSDGRTLEVHTLSAPPSGRPCRDGAWSYWIASGIASGSASAPPGS
jgi:hypothetical protein